MKYQADKRIYCSFTDGPKASKNKKTLTLQLVLDTNALLVH